MKMIDIVKGNKGVFSFYRGGKLYYDIIDHKTNNKICIIPVNIFDKRDIGNASYNAKLNAIMLMRYIRKAIANDSIAFYEEYMHI